MRVVDPGHQYALTHLDGNLEELLTFVKREGEKYPGNVGSHPGTNIQEVLRVCIDRVRFLEAQEPSPYNPRVIFNLREALRQLEYRAAERHHRMAVIHLEAIEELPVCPICGHIGCNEVPHLVERSNPICKHSAE